MLPPPQRHPPSSHMRQRPHITITNTETLRRAANTLSNLLMYIEDKEAVEHLVGGFDFWEIDKIADELHNDLNERTF